MTFDPNSIFISYAWGGLSEEVANDLDQLLTKNGLLLIRDKKDLGFKGLIKEFMEEIGKGNFVLLVISDKYLKSPNCMFELLEVQKKGTIHQRVFPVVLPDANIYKPIGIISYLKYWEDQIEELNNALKELDSFADTQGIRDDIDLYTDIRGTIAQLASIFRNMNTLSLDEMKAKNYSPLLDQLLNKSQENQPLPRKSASKKQGKVLYHIPDMMQLDHWTRCIVRLAWDEILLKEGLNLPKEAEMIEDIRLGKVMQVNLEEGQGGGNFEIKSLSSTEQAIFEDDFTEWLFDVKARFEGTFNLILRVTLLQIIEGFGERKKDIVLERTVKIEAFVPEALPKLEVAQENLTQSNENGFDKSVKKPFQMNSDLEESFPKPPTARKKASAKKRSSASEKAESKTYKKDWSNPKMEIPPAPMPGFSPQEETPRKSKPIFRKLMPYAASLVVLILAGIFVLPNFFSNSKDSSGEIVAEETVGSRDENASAVPDKSNQNVTSGQLKDISGNWQISDKQGNTSTLVIDQYDDTFDFLEYNSSGQEVGEGSGKVINNQITAEYFNSIIQINGTLTLNTVDGGKSWSGSISFPSEGKSTNILMNRINP